MTSELRPAVAVWIDAKEAYARSHKPDPQDSRITLADPFEPAAAIQAYGDEREAKGREEQATELAKYKALAETLAGELQQIEVDAMEYYNEWRETGCDQKDAIRFAFGLGEETRKALREYKEARDAS